MGLLRLLVFQSGSKFVVGMEIRIDATSSFPVLVFSTFWRKLGEWNAGMGSSRGNEKLWGIVWIMICWFFAFWEIYDLDLTPLLLEREKICCNLCCLWPVMPARNYATMQMRLETTAYLYWGNWISYPSLTIFVQHEVNIFWDKRHKND